MRILLKLVIDCDADAAWRARALAPRGRRALRAAARPRAARSEWAADDRGSPATTSRCSSAAVGAHADGAAAHPRERAIRAMSPPAGCGSSATAASRSPVRSRASTCGTTRWRSHPRRATRRDAVARSARDRRSRRRPRSGPCSGRSGSGARRGSGRWRRRGRTTPSRRQTPRPTRERLTMAEVVVRRAVAEDAPGVGAGARRIAGARPTPAGCRSRSSTTWTSTARRASGGP